MRTGCSGQICASEDVITTCEWREEYACYDTATCETQADGRCGWTPTAELDACLASASSATTTVTLE
jgi:eight-cysteine-cluster-containing protein